jgi:hypothetical protein
MSRRRNQFIPEYFLAACAVAIAVVLAAFIVPISLADGDPPTHAPHCYGKGC